MPEWTLPDSPSDRRYKAFYREVKENPNRRIAYAILARVAEADFYAFARYVSSFGNYPIRDRGHSRYGKLWVDEPFVFEKCRELQQDSEEAVDDKFYNWSRFFFKTELVTKLLSLWELLKDPTLTFAIITHKVDQAGLQIFRGPQGEMEQNPLLPACWPAIFLPDYRDYKLWTITACTILRQPGIREPTFSIHGLDNLPDSGHYRRLIPDDAITARAVENPRAIAKAERQMRRITPLSQDDTVTRWVGTVWDENDPNMQWVKKGLFSGGRDHEPGLVHPKRLPWSTNAKLEEWTPQLRSLAFFSKWRRKLGEYEFSCQVMGAPVARSEQNFDLEWIKEYDTPIREQAKKCRVQLILDPAGERNEEKDETDYWVWRVLGPGADGNTYHFDLWRERATLVEALDLTFALVKHWKPEQVWVEDYSSGTFAAIRREMELRAYRFRLRKLPQIKRSKESRIKLLQAPYQRGSIWYPREGFNHGSGPFYQDMIRVATEPGGEFTPRSKVVDKRDTYQQFREDEYTRWVPIKGVVIHDDMLDCEAWAFQEEVRTLMPKPERLESVVNFNPHAEHQRGINRSYEPSAWVF